MIKIGVVMGSKPTTFSKDPHYALEIRYFTAIEKAGAMAIPVTYTNIEQQLENLDGLLLPGGDFYTPECYYKEQQCAPYKDEGIWFDAYMAIGNYCLVNNIPLLGICGGMQILAVLLNCKLKQGLENHRSTDNKKLEHYIDIKKDSKLFEIFNKERIYINSIHREAVAQISDDVDVTAIANDGTIEAIESKKHNFAVGVQWHPEILVNTEQDKIFEYFINKCKK